MLDGKPIDSDAVKAVMRTLKSAVQGVANAYYEGMRVRVLDGAKEQELGRGTIVDHVTVYAGVTADGHLQSLRFAEQSFEGAQRIDDNPKIQMDDGTVRYGCQVWWEPVKEDRGDAERDQRAD